MNRLDGKVAMISGAARGIGAETARLMAEAGARIVVTDILEEDGRALVAELNGDGSQALFLRQDVTREEDWEAAMAQVLDRFGGLHVLVNNAGIYFAKAIEETTLEEWRRVSAINVDGVFLGTKHAIRAMRETARRDPDAWARSGGSIVNLSSVAGLVGVPLGGAYHMSKGAVRLFTKTAAVECAQFGYRIRVNSVHPGLIETQMGEDLLSIFTSTGLFGGANEVREFFTSAHPLGRLGQASDVARAILYLASDDAAFVTGAELVVDGGFTAR